MARPIFGSCLRAMAEDSDGGDREHIPARTPRANDARSVRGSERISDGEHSGVEGPTAPGRGRQTTPVALPTPSARLIQIPAHPPLCVATALDGGIRGDVPNRNLLPTARTSPPLNLIANRPRAGPRTPPAQANSA